MATEDSDDEDDSEELEVSDAEEVTLLLDEVEPEPVGSQAVSATSEAIRIREAVVFMLSSPW
ncbi:hypothetical protein ABAC402_04435 [Asticcacaulis sp. AC402]|nr:hypothetical protein ABAC402_04435 [Asticcacaulis sp. AC402]